MHLVDTHVHLDLYPDFSDVVAETDKAQIYTIAVTNTPSVYERSSKITLGSKYIRTAVGLHPELVAQRHSEVALFEELAKVNRYIGEVGLDFVAPDSDVRALQKKVFGKILRVCADQGNKIITVHSRRAAQQVLELIGPGFPGSIILHWFSGATSLIPKAAKQGCFFSVNLPMTYSETGRDVIRRIPIERLLLESDGPFAKRGERPCRPSDGMEVLQGVAAIVNMQPEEVLARVWQNFSQILGEQDFKL